MTSRRTRTNDRRRDAATGTTEDAAARPSAGRSVLRFAGRSMRALVFPVTAAAVVSVVLLIGVFPARAYLDQKQDIVDAQTRLTELTDGNKRAKDDLARLTTDAEIERVAREQLHLVKPGEEVYRIMPAPQDPLTVPNEWPFDGLRKRMRAQPPPTLPAPPDSTTTTAPVPTTATTVPAPKR